MSSPSRAKDAARSLSGIHSPPVRLRACPVLVHCLAPSSQRFTALSPAGLGGLGARAAPRCLGGRLGEFGIRAAGAEPVEFGTVGVGLLLGAFGAGAQVGAERSEAASARSERSRSAPVILPMVTGLASSAALMVVPFFSAASRRRSRHADTRVWPRPAQYSGGRPGPSAEAAGCLHPGNLHTARDALTVVFWLAIGTPVLAAAPVSRDLSYR
jgi:hypothetical protein